MHHVLSFSKIPKSSTATGYRLVSSKQSTPLFRVENAQIFQFGSVEPTHKEHLNWTMDWNPTKESWAIIGDEKGTVLDFLRGRLRVSPLQQGGMWPLLLEQKPQDDPFSLISYASFATRRKTGGGGFYDYTARYGAVREEDKVTLRGSVSEDVANRPELADHIATLARKLDLDRFLDLPLIALSNGQTRRAHVMRELLKNPMVLLLDEPFTGLDARHRPLLSQLLCELHRTAAPRIIMGLRKHDPIPEWITNVVIAEEGQLQMRPTSEMPTPPIPPLPYDAGSVKMPSETQKRYEDSNQPKLVDMKGLSVAYHERKVLQDINWTIREGERWHLQGANGSGKTTLLSMILGDHPQSYGQAHLHIFGQPRKSTSTIQIQQQIGFVSPELFNAFPRRMGPQGLTVRDAIGTGFQSTFSYRKVSEAENSQISAILQELGPSAWSDGSSSRQETFGEELFASLTSGEQSLVLLMRALISRNRLLILDEPFAGMTDKMVLSAKNFLATRLKDHQAVVFITHWEHEVPWPDVQRIALNDGRAIMQ